MMRSLVQSNREGLCLGEARETSLSKKEATVRLGCGGKILESRAVLLPLASRRLGHQLGSQGGGQGGKLEETAVRNYCLGVDGKATEETQACEPMENDSLRSENTNLK